MKISLKTILNLTLALTMGLSASAAHADLDKRDAKEDEIYEKTLALCKAAQFSVENLTSMEGHMAVGELMLGSAVETLVDLNLGVNASLEEMLSNYWFYKALDQCYGVSREKGYLAGKNTFNKRMFVMQLLAADRIAKIGTIALAALITKAGVGKVLGSLTKLKMNYITRVLQFSKNPKIAVQIVANAHHAANPKLWAAYYAANGALIGSGIVEATKEALKEEPSIPFTEPSPDDFFKSLPEATPDEKELVRQREQNRNNNLIKQYEEQMKFYQELINSPNATEDQKSFAREQLARIANKRKGLNLNP